MKNQVNIFIVIITLSNSLLGQVSQVNLCNSNATEYTDNSNFDWESNWGSGVTDGTFQYTNIYWNSCGRNYTSNPSIETLPVNSNFEYIRVNSPWDSPGNNTYDLYSQRIDGKLKNKKEDGWVLVQKKFGTPQNPVEKSAYFILYNKYQGILRFFFLLDESMLCQITNPTTAIIEFSFANQYESSTFAHIDGFLNGNDFFVKNRVISIPNSISNNRWFRVDLPIYYDPCSCMDFESKIPKLKFSVKSISKANVNLTTIFSGNAVGQLNGSSNTSSYTNEYDFSYMNTSNTKTENEKEVSGYVNSTSDAKPKTQDLDLSHYNINPDREGMQEPTKDPRCPGKKRKQFRMMGVLTDDCDDNDTPAEDASFYSFFNGSYSESSTTFFSDMTLNFKGEAKTFGSIETSTELMYPMYLKLPGKNATDNPNSNNETPFYNKPLGVISLLNTPKVAVQEYEPNGSVAECVKKYQGEEKNGVMIVWPDELIRKAKYSMPKIREYKLKEDLKVMLNPNADVDVLSVKSTLLFNYSGVPDTLRAYHDYKNEKFYICRTSGSCEYSSFTCSGRQKSLVDMENCAQVGALNGDHKDYDFNVSNIEDFKYLNGPVLLNNAIGNKNPTFEEYQSYVGYNAMEIDIYKPGSKALKDFVYSTPYTNLNCSNHYTAKFFESRGVFPDVKLKLVVKLRKKNSSNANDIYYIIQTYNVDQEITKDGKKYNYEREEDSEHSAQNMLSLKVTSFEQSAIEGWPSFDYWKDKDYNIDLVNPFIFFYSREYKAFNSVNIKASQTTLSNVKLEIKAGNRITIQHNNSRVSIAGDVKLKSNFIYSEPSECANNVIPIVSSAEVISNCQNINGYYKNAGYHLKSAENLEVKTRLNFEINNFTLSPNPATSKLNISYTLAESSNVKLVLTEIMGHEVSEIFNNEVEKGNHTFTKISPSYPVESIS